jgi:hypothetical protein
MLWQVIRTYPLPLQKPALSRSTGQQQGRTIAQATASRLPTEAARIQPQVRSWEQSGTGAAFLRVLRFPSQFSLQHYYIDVKYISARLLFYE